MALPIEQIALKVLAKAGLERGSQDPADLQNASDVYTAVYEQLKDDGLVTWAISEDIPDRFSLPIITLCLAEVAGFYGTPPPAEGWENSKTLARNTIRRQLASGQDNEPTNACYF